jgi:hypothetical protein
MRNRALVLCSLNAVTKDASIMTRILGRATPDPRLGSSVELGRRHTYRLFDFIGSGETLSRKSITAEKPPPAFLQVQPTGSRRNKDMMQTWMLDQPGTSLRAVMTTEIIRDDEDVTTGIIGFDVLKERDVVRGVAGSNTTSQFLAVSHAECSIDPGLLRTATVVQWCFEAVPISRPAWSGRKAARNYGPEFVGADGRRAFGWLGVVADDRCSFGTKSGS